MRYEAAGPSAVSYRVLGGRIRAECAGRPPTDGLGEIRTAFDWRNFAHSLDVNKPSDLETYSGKLGLHYRTQKGQSIGTEAVMRVAEYPNRAFALGNVLDNAFVQRGIGLVSDYQVTGKSKLRGLLGYTQHRHEHLADRDSVTLPADLDISGT